MKNLFFLAALILFLAACTNVNFVNPQPEFVDALTEIPEKYHGEFLIRGDDKDTHTVTRNTIDGRSISADSLVVKERGNYFYINTMNDNGYYELRIIQLIKFLNHEEITLRAPRLEEKQLKWFNAEFIGDAKYDTVLINNVNINQLSILTNSSRSMKVLRLK